MPTLPCDQRASDFNTLIYDHVAALELGFVSLAEGCERLAKQREASLREENKLLQQENERLRRRLDTNNSGSNQQKDGDMVADPPNTTIVPLAPNASDGKFIADVDAPATDSEKGIAAPAKQAVSFKLLPEYMADTWVTNECDEVGDSGYFNRDEPDIIEEFVSTKKLVVDPSSEVRLAWDILGIPILSWDLITIPLGVFTLGSLGDDIFSGMGWVTLIYWTIDLPFTFLTGYFDSEGTLIMDVKAIAKHYMHGFFGLDICIILADWLSVIMELVGGGGGGLLSNVAVLRVFRITRFARLMRLRKLKAKIQTIEDGINSEWVLVIMNLCGKVFSIILINHYVCCLWYLIGTTESLEVPERRWVSSFPLFLNDREGPKLIDGLWHYQYFTSLHWAIAQFTPGPHPVQPQNSAERVFAIFVLLFGLVVFSSFIAGVTQARMQLNKMMSKLDRDMWMLRKFCRQYGVSRELSIRMKRYIDLVIVPNYHKLNVPDVVLIPKLSAHLRSKLNSELLSQIVCIHPFLGHVRGNYDAVMDAVCNGVVESMSLARGDVAFGSGQVARGMFIVTDGLLDYIPVADSESGMQVVKKGRWVAEATLWTKWVHQGQLQAGLESKAHVVDSAKLRVEVLKNGLVMPFVRKYGVEFIRRLNILAEETEGMVTDLHDDITAEIPITTTTTRFTDVGKQQALNLLPRLSERY